ncbi:MAG: LuxR C-terminal-related transcriptional regulator, partial [Chloroflexota bacterium]
ALEESLALAQPGGFIRLYVDLGPKMAELLRHLHNREPYSEYVTNILGAFADTARLNSEPAGNGQLIEPLTERELEILALLGKRYSNKEIAAELVISPETVKRHAINIYQKLAVHNRRDAVEVAGALGLIPPP